MTTNNNNDQRNLKKILRVPGTLRLFMIITIIAIVGALTTSVIMVNQSISKYKKASKDIWVMDKSGGITSAKRINQNIRTRKFEYEDHVKQFYRLAYAFDEGNYKRNMEKLMWLSGDCGKELVNQNIQSNVYEELVQKNLKTYVEIEKINVNLETNPVSGEIYGIQHSEREGLKKARELDVKFELKDVYRSSKNPHGVKIITWEVVNQKIINRNGQ